MGTIVNASAQVNFEGTDDKSTVIVTPEQALIPQHLPKFFIFGKKGSTKPTLVSGGQMLSLYGAETFDKNGVFFNHATLFATNIAAQANTLMLQRVVPDDAGPESNGILYMDIVADDVPNYLRNSDGGIVADPSTGVLQVNATTPTISGYRVKYIVEHSTTGIVLGAATSKTGTMTAVVGGATSTMYPILELKAKYQGEYYNNIGIKIESTLAAEVPDALITDTKVLPYKLGLVTRPDGKSSPTVSKTNFGTVSSSFTFKEDAVNPLTDATFDVGSVFPGNWSNETDPIRELKYSDYEDMTVHYDNIETILGLFATSEAPYVTTTVTTWEDGVDAATLSWFNFTTDDDATIVADERHLLDFVSLKSTNNVNYFTVIADDTTPTLTATQKEVQLSSSTPFYLNGGGDGTLDNTNFESLVVKEMAKYIDPDSEVMDLAVNVESIMYDSGFTLATKRELCNFIALRPDTFICLCPHDASLKQGFLSLDEERAVAVSLRTKLQLTPESTSFGTPVMRGMIPGGTGILTDDSMKDRIPQLLDISVKAARYMGAGSGKWNPVYNFDTAPGNIITELKDLEPSFIPAGVKPLLWSAGLVWSQAFGPRQFHYPALQTVYENDTSVLNSFFTAMAICTINKIAAEAWRNFTGSSKMTQLELADAVTAFIKARLLGKFDSRFTIVPEVVFTEADIQRGYSWTLITKISASNMRTVMTSRVEAYRLDNA